MRAPGTMALMMVPVIWVTRPRTSSNRASSIERASRSVM
jgi:hypothetical protein